MITEALAFQVFKTVVVLGLAAWSVVVVVNNIVGFKSAAAAIARTMSMALLETEPRIETPLLSRKLTSAGWGRAALAVILILQLTAAVALSLGGVEFLRACLGVPADRVAQALAILGLAVNVLIWILMMTGGLWFAYWIRQEGLQLTHIALLVMTLAAALVVKA